MLRRVVSRAASLGGALTLLCAGVAIAAGRETVTETEHVFRFRIGQSVRPGSVVINDFNFQKPKLPLEAKADAGRDKGLEFSENETPAGPTRAACGRC